MNFYLFSYLNFWRFPAFYFSYFSTFFSLSSDSFRFFSIFGRFLVTLLITPLSFSIISFNSCTFFTNAFCLSSRSFNYYFVWARFWLSPGFYYWQAPQSFFSCSSIYLEITVTLFFDSSMFFRRSAFSLSKFWTSRRNAALGITSIYFLLLSTWWRSSAKLRWTSSLTFFFSDRTFSL